MNRIFYKKYNTTGSKKANCLKIFYFIFSFLFLDFLVRFALNGNLKFSSYSAVPYILTICWSLVFFAIVSLLPRLAGRMIYGILYFLWAFYSIVQVGYYSIFKSFLYISDFKMTENLSQSIGFVKHMVSIKSVFFVVLLILIGAAGIALFPKFKFEGMKKLLYLISAVIGALGIVVVPAVCYGEKIDIGDPKGLSSPSFEYRNFSTSVVDMELTGIYHYVAHDLRLNAAAKSEGDNLEKIKLIDDYFAARQTGGENNMTGLFEGKNCIVVMMESVDDWLINEENTPTLCYMMRNGINFENMFTPKYHSGATFSTEFAYNTGNFPYSNGINARRLTDMSFNESVAKLFTDKGYSADMFRKNTPKSYNRGDVNNTFGYNSFNSYLDYSEDKKIVKIDTFLPENDELYALMTKEKPFYDFVAAYSAHPPYDSGNYMSGYAFEKYPQYNNPDRPKEVNYISAQAKLTDDMFKELLQRLDSDGLLDDTVIIGFTDHYSYGLTNKELLKWLSANTGSEIVEKTPAFIYYKNLENNIAVDKVMQPVDLLPTIANLFNLDCPDVLGRDAFDDTYDGYAVFPNGTWVNNRAYCKEGIIQYNNGMTDEEIEEMNGFVSTFYVINNYILDTDYYSDNEN